MEAPFKHKNCASTCSRRWSLTQRTYLIFLGTLLMDSPVRIGDSPKWPCASPRDSPYWNLATSLNWYISQVWLPPSLFSPNTPNTPLPSLPLLSKPQPQSLKCLIRYTLIPARFPKIEIEGTSGNVAERCSSRPSWLISRTVMEHWQLFTSSSNTIQHLLFNLQGLSWGIWVFVSFSTLI